MALRLYGDGNIENVTSINTAVSSTELGYLDGVTSSIQDQANTIGLEHIYSESFSGSTICNVSNYVFSSQCDNYRVIIHVGTETTQAEIKMHVQIGGASQTNANYYVATTGFTSLSGVDNYAQSASTYISLGHATPNDPLTAQLDFFGPYTTKRTKITGILGGVNGAGNAQVVRAIQASYNTQVAVDSFRIYNNDSQNLQGTISLYGYRKS